MEKLTKEEMQDLEQVFAIARQSVAADERALIGLINFKAKLLEKLKPITPTFSETIKKDLNKKNAPLKK
jgi:hypothetical protein